MKMKTWTILLAVTLIISLGTASTALADSLSVVVDGKPLSPEVAPVVENGRTLVPLRAIFEALNTSVEWDGSTQTVTAVKAAEGTHLKLTIGSVTAYRNDSPITLDIPARIVDGRTLVPLRFVSESLGAVVKWDADTQTVTITSKPGLPSSSGNNPEALYEQAAGELHVGYYDSALRHLDQAINQGFNASLAYYDRGIIYERLGNFEQAISNYDRAIQIDPTVYPYFYNHRGRAHREMGQLELARSDYQSARSLGYISQRLEYSSSSDVKSGGMMGVELYKRNSGLNGEDFSMLKYGLPRLTDGTSPPFKKDWVYFDQDSNTVYIGYFLEGAAFDAYAQGRFNLEEVFTETVNVLQQRHPGAKVYGWVQLEELISDPKDPPLHGVDAAYRQAENGWLMNFTINYFGKDTDGYLSICREAVG